MALTEPTFVAPRRRSGFLQRPDCEIYFELTGSGPAIVFMHGLGGNHLSWWQQVAHFAPRFTCVTFAHRGFAPSSSFPDGPNPADFADDLGALLDHLALGKAYLVGQSMGGWTGVEFTLRNPLRVSGLVLANTVGTLDMGRLGETERKRFDDWMTQADAQAAAGFANGVHPACGERMAREQPALHQLYRHIDDMAGKMDKQAMRARLFSSRNRSPHDINAITCPVLFIIGQEDIVIPPFAADTIAALAPHARVAKVEKSGHSAYFERAAEFNGHLDAFLSA